jgi:aminoglycoside 6'-N-acetyltransferase
VTQGGEHSAAARPAAPRPEGAPPAVPPVLRGRLVTLRPASAADAPALLAVLEQPEVAAWWRRAEWERLDETDALSFVIELDGAPVGCIQFSEELDPDYYAAAVDIFVSAAVHGRGVGPDAMRTLIAWLIDVRGHHRVTVDPAAANARAIHVYEMLGFRPVGVLRQYERVEDGTWREALLMELLAADFVRDASR